MDGEPLVPPTSTTLGPVDELGEGPSRGDDDEQIGVLGLGVTVVPKQRTSWIHPNRKESLHFLLLFQYRLFGGGATVDKRGVCTRFSGSQWTPQETIKNNT